VSASDRAIELTLVAATAASEKLAADIVALDVSETLVITDVFLICSAGSERQVKAIVEGIEQALDRIDVDPIRREGERDGRWVLLDYLDLVVHVQHEEERGFYGLDRLWKDCPVVELPEAVTAGQPARTKA
jgi:ribosome-associated protein